MGEKREIMEGTEVGGGGTTWTLPKDLLCSSESLQLIAMVLFYEVTNEYVLLTRSSVLPKLMALISRRIVRNHWRLVRPFLIPRTFVDASWRASTVSLFFPPHPVHPSPSLGYS